jgi:hypothetical protein
MELVQLSEKIRSQREAAQRLQFFDCSLWIGTPEGFPLSRELRLEALESEMREHFITGGLLSHWLGKTLSAQAGNLLLQEMSSLLPEGMYTLWTGLPLYPEDAGPIPGMGTAYKGMHGVRIFPTSHNYVAEPWILGELCEWLKTHNLPLFIWHTEIDLRSLHALALRFPGLPIVLETQTQKILYHARTLFSLMRECPNVHIETSNFVGADYLEYSVSEFGARRLLYGSFLPVNDPFVGIGMILDADIPEKDKSLIAGGNLRRMIKEVNL